MSIQDFNPPPFRVYAVMSILLLLCSLQAKAVSVIAISQSNPNFKVEQVATELGVPWGMAFLNDDELIFTERRGNIKILNLDNLEITRLGGSADVVAEGQGGMLDVAKAPDYTAGGWLYFTYSKSTAAGVVTTLARAKRDSNQLTDWQDLLVTTSATRTGRHFGSRIAFDQNGHVFFGIGDRGKRDNAQNLNRMCCRKSGAMVIATPRGFYSMPLKVICGRLNMARVAVTKSIWLKRAVITVGR
jgi:glucose/arabinose dehydrogenase